MRILISCCPLYGHVNTVLPLAFAAQRAGHQVAVATGADLVGHVERRGVPAWPVGPTHAEAVSRTSPSVEYFTETAEKRALDLVPRAADWRPDLVVHEETELAGAVAAAHTGARHAVHGLGLMPPIRIWEAFAPAIERLYRQWGVPNRADTVWDTTYLHVCPPALQPPGERIWDRVQPLRPTAGAPAASERLPHAVAALPYVQTIHLTLGTVFFDNPAVLHTAIAGLRELPANLVVTSGPGTDPARFGPQPAHVLIEPYLPHTLLLPRCHLVVSQGGAGIMFGALGHGLAQLVLPQGADQFMNADACRDAGAALSLAAEEVSAAGAVRAEIEAMPSPDEVLAALEHSP